MKVSVGRKPLFEAVNAVSRMVSRQTTLPILKCVLFRTLEGGVQLEATDLEQNLRVFVPAQIETSGTCAIEGKMLRDMLAALPEQELVLTRAGDDLLISGPKANVRVTGMDPGDWTERSTVNTVGRLAVKEGELRTALQHCIRAVNTDSVRPNLNSVHFSRRGNILRLAATDTHRLHHAEVEMAEYQEGESVSPGLNHILPSEAIDDLLKLLTAKSETPVEMEWDPHMALFRVGTDELWTALIDGQYPQYDRVIPQAHLRCVTVRRSDLVDSIRRVGIVAATSPVKDGITFSAKEGVLTLSATGERGRIQDQVEIKLEGSPIVWRTNFHYLSETLATFETEEVDLKLMERESPILIEPHGGGNIKLLSVAMPMQFPQEEVEQYLQTESDLVLA